MLKHYFHNKLTWASFSDAAMEIMSAEKKKHILKALPLTGVKYTEKRRRNDQNNSARNIRKTTTNTKLFMTWPARHHLIS